MAISTNKYHHCEKNNFNCFFFSWQSPIVKLACPYRCHYKSFKVIKNLCNLLDYKEIEVKLNLEYKQRENLDKENETEEYFDELNLFDYIYAVLYNENYREKYKEFLKIEFPRVPYPTDKDLFFKLANLGKQLRKSQ